MVDDSEDDDLRASLLTGLTHTARRSESSRPGTPRLSMAAPAEAAAEPDFRSAVEELRRSTGSKQLEKAAESYLSGGRTLERE